MSLDRRWHVVAGATVAALIGFGLLWHARADEVGAALDLFPLWGLAACVLLHLLTLVARSEAWRLTLSAVDGRPVPRAAVHGANAGAFCCGALMAHLAMPARVAMLRRLGGARAPGPGQIMVADVPIFLMEVVGTAALLAVAGELWALPIAVAPLAAARVLHGRLGARPSARGLRVLADDRLAIRLAGWVGAITGLAAARVWLTLALLQLPSGASQTAATFASLGVFGLLPLGPAAPAAGTLASSGAGEVALGLAAGVVICASTMLAVAIYASLVVLVALSQSGMAYASGARPRLLSLASAAAATLGPTTQPVFPAGQEWPDEVVAPNTVTSNSRAIRGRLVRARARRRLG